MTRGEVIADGWDSDAVEDALSLCLACKGCKADCPVGVDIATWKAEFRAHHYERRMRPRSAYSMGQSTRWASIASKAPGLANLLAGTGLGEMDRGNPPRRSGSKIRSDDLPTLVSKTIARTIQWGATRAALADTFNNHFRPATLIAATQLLERSGFEVAIPKKPLCCGRPLYDWGYLEQAKQQFEDTFELLRGDLRKGTPIIVAEPACASAFKDELMNLFPQRAEAKLLFAHVHYVADFVAERLRRFPAFPLAARSSSSRIAIIIR